MTGYAIVADDGFRATTIIGGLMNYRGDVRKLKLEVPVSFRTYNWLVDPPESLEVLFDRMVHLIARRAKKRIVLCYTGGTDSATIAYYFAKAGVEIEYLHYTQPLKNSLFDSDKHVDKKVEELEELHRRFQRPPPIIHLRQATYFVKEYNDYLFKDPHFYDNDEVSHINRNYKGTTSDMFRNLDEFQDDLIIYGLEKPKLHMDEHGIYWMMESEMYSAMLSKRVYDRVAFYADQTMPEIFAKQCHEVLKYVLHNNPTRQEMSTRLHVVQHEVEYYHLWSKLVGRVTDEKRSILTYLTKPHTNIPYGFSFNEINKYEEFVSNRLKEHDAHESKNFFEVRNYLMTLPTVNPLSDKFYVYRFPV